MSATDIKSSSSAAASSSGAQQTQAAVQPTTDDDGPNFDVAAVVQANGLGQLTHYFWVQGADGQDYWGICTIGEDGLEHVTYTDDYGNIVQGGDVATASTAPTVGYTGSTQFSSTGGDAYDGAEFDVAAVAADANLGRYTHYFWVEGADGQDYWGICAVGDDGVEHVTYTDAYGSVIQGGDVPTASGVVPDGPTKTN